MKKHTMTFDAYTRGRMKREAGMNPQLWSAVFDIPTAIIRNSIIGHHEPSWPAAMEKVTKHFDGGSTGSTVRSSIEKSHRVETNVTTGPGRSIYLKICFITKKGMEIFVINLGLEEKTGRVVMMHTGETTTAT